jgi:hypothetical protein
MAKEEPRIDWERNLSLHLLSPYWADLKARVRESRGNRCERCKRRRSRRLWLTLHHKHYDTLGHESIRDVELLCDRCHRHRRGVELDRDCRDKNQSP